MKYPNVGDFTGMEYIDVIEDEARIGEFPWNVFELRTNTYINVLLDLIKDLVLVEREETSGPKITFMDKFSSDMAGL